MSAARPTDTETAVIVPVAAAEPAVADHRLRLDVAAGWGVPAHVTVLYPFVPPHAITDEVLSRLTAAIAGVPAFDCALTRCRWFGDEVLWLDPDPAAPFGELTARVAAEFPDHPPYGGRFVDVVPHLSVGESRAGTVAELLTAEQEVARHLPIDARIDHAVLIAGTDRPGSWHRLATLSLG